MATEIIDTHMRYASDKLLFILRLPTCVTLMMTSGILFNSGSGSGLTPVRHQTITRLSLNWTPYIKGLEDVKISLSIHLNLSSVKYLPLCQSLNVLRLFALASLHSHQT